MNELIELLGIGDIIPLRIGKCTNVLGTAVEMTGLGGEVYKITPDRQVQTGATYTFYDDGRIVSEVNVSDIYEIEIER